MCGHDWCSVRISKEFVEFASGKAEGFTRERVIKSPGLSPEQEAILAARGHLPPDEIHRLAKKTRQAVGAEDGKASCHSDYVDPDSATHIQKKKLVQLGRKSPSAEA